MCLSQHVLDHRAECSIVRHFVCCLISHSNLKLGTVRAVAFASGIGKHYKSGLPPTKIGENRMRQLGM